MEKDEPEKRGAENRSVFSALFIRMERVFAGMLILKRDDYVKWKKNIKYYKIKLDDSCDRGNFRWAGN